MIKGRKKGYHLNPKVTPEIEQRMQELREEGLSYLKIGREVGVAGSTVQYHLDPEYESYAKKRAIEWQIKNPEKARLQKKSFRQRHASRYPGRCIKQKRERLRQKAE